MSDNQRILIYRIGQLGDSMVALPAVWAVRDHFSGAHLALLTDGYASGRPPTMIDLLPERLAFDEVIYYQPDPTGGIPWGMLKVLPRLRAARFDALVYLAPRRRPAKQVWRDLAYFRLAGIKQFFAHRGFTDLPPRVPGQPLPFVEHEADHLLSRLEVTGIPVPPLAERRLDLRFSAEELAAARGWLAAQLPAEHVGRVIGVGPGSKMPAKVWPEDRFVELVRALIGEPGIYPVVLGGPELEGLGKRLIAAWGRGINGAGRLGIRQAAAVLSHCRLFVGNDTGTMHLAAGANTPCVAIFAAIEWPGKWYPYGRGHRVLRQSVSCEGCRLVECVEHQMECLKAITVEDAVVACRTALSESATQAPATGCRAV
jgi:ADP-heptose:LPS heptosyltransferase